jgi:glutamate/tyrosine decarboxylase-like PLP-dependent enzyme
VPLGAGVFFTRHPDALSRAFGVDTGYVPPTIAGGGFTRRRCSGRGGSSASLLFALAEHGEAGVAAFIDHQARMET